MSKRTEFETAATSTKNYEVMKRNLLRRKRKTKKDEEFKDLQFTSLDKMNFRYIHSNTQTFLSTYKLFKSQYNSEKFMSAAQKTAYDMNVEVLNALKKKEDEFAKQFATDKQKTLEFFQSNIDKTVDQAYEQARTIAIQQSYAQLDKVNLPQLSKALNTLVNFWEQSFDTESVPEYQKRLNNLKTQCRAIIKGDVNALESLSRTLPIGLGLIEEILKQKALNNTKQNIVAELTGTKSHKLDVSFLDDNVKIKHGAGLSDIVLTINKPNVDINQIGINIKSNEKYYQNKDRSLSPADIVSDIQSYNKWALFSQYVYWNALALLSWHTDTSLDVPAELKNILHETLLDVNQHFLSAVYLLGLPSIFIANDVDAPGITQFNNPATIQNVAINYLDKQVNNLFIILHNKIYWTSEIYEKAMKMYNNPEKANTISADRVTVGNHVPITIYNIKAQWLREHRKDFEEGHDFYPELQQQLEKANLLNSLVGTRMGGVWHFLRGTQKDKGFRIKLKYRI